jgi:hypothetical protein
MDTPVSNRLGFHPDRPARAFGGGFHAAQDLDGVENLAGVPRRDVGALGEVGIRDRPTAPGSPWQNGHAERLIGSIRRECLDHIIVLGENHLYRILKTYADYYIEDQPHLALGKDAPNHRPIQRQGPIMAGQSWAGSIIATPGCSFR